MNTVEDCIEILAGIQERTGEFNLDRSDYNLITSLARQTFRGIGYTDRQLDLAKEKVEHYRNQYESNGYEIDFALENTRLDVRKIDRSRWVRVVDTSAKHRPLSEDGPWIAVRFIFQKKLISSIDAIKRSLGDGTYDKENKIHYFPLNEKTVYEIVSIFNESNNFEVQEELKEYYEKLVDMNENKNNYLPGIYGFKLKNLHEKSLGYAISTIGEPTKENLHQYYDQRERYGLHHFDESDINNAIKNLTVLSKKLLQRNQSHVLVHKTQHTIEHLIESVFELYRFPLLVVLNDKDCYDNLVKFHKTFRGIIPNESCSVMFRLDNDEEGMEFNQYIKSNTLNNQVDKNTKIVYINSNKLPKPLLKSDWEPIAAIVNHTAYNGRENKVQTYVSNLDLVMYYDDDIGPWNRNLIEKL